MNVISPKGPKAKISLEEVERRREALRQADANNRIAGLIPTPESHAIFEAFVQGEIEFDDILPRIGALPHNDPAAAIRALAEQHKIAYAETACDLLGHHITRLAGDDVELDENELLLLALERAGHVSPTDAVKLHANYLRHAKA